jgi:hypothetical protein
MYVNVRHAATMPAVALTGRALVNTLYFAPRDYMRPDSPWIDSETAHRDI